MLLNTFKYSFLVTKIEAHIVAVAYGSLSQYSTVLFSLFSLYVLLVSLCTIGSAFNIRYTCQDLRDIGDQHQTSVLWDNIPNHIARAQGSPWIVIGARQGHRERRERKQKWGRRSCVMLRLKKTTTHATSGKPLPLQCQIPCA